jgi:hypothetical protein
MCMNSFPPACPELVNDTLIPEPRPNLTMAGETPRKTPAYMQLLSDNENAMFEKYDATREEHKKDEVGEELRALQQREAPNHAESGKLQRMQIRTLANATPLSTPLADSRASHRDLLELDYSKKRSRTSSSAFDRLSRRQSSEAASVGNTGNRDMAPPNVVSSGYSMGRSLRGGSFSQGGISSPSQVHVREYPEVASPQVDNGSSTGDRGEARKSPRVVGAWCCRCGCGGTQQHS